MAEGINVRFSGNLQQFIQSRVGASGLYGSASEYIRDLVRHDYERDEEKKMRGLLDELRAGAEADESQFIPLDVEAVLKKIRSRPKADAR